MPNGLFTSRSSSKSSTAARSPVRLTKGTRSVPLWLEHRQACAEEERTEAAKKEKQGQVQGSLSQVAAGSPAASVQELRQDQPLEQRVLQELRQDPPLGQGELRLVRVAQESPGHSVEQGRVVAQTWCSARQELRQTSTDWKTLPVPLEYGA